MSACIQSAKPDCVDPDSVVALPTNPTFVAFEKLRRARNVLGGRNENGCPAHPSMFDTDVVSFAHGEGIRRPHPTVVAAGVRALLDYRTSSLENYLFLQRLGPLDDAI